MADQTKMAVSDSQLYPLNRNLIKNVEDNVIFFWPEKCFITIIFEQQKIGINPGIHGTIRNIFSYRILGKGTESLPHTQIVNLPYFKHKIIWPQLGTLELDTFNPDCLIRISTLFLDIVQKNQKPVFQN